MIQPADFAVAVTQQVEVTTKDGVNGRVIALGWWTESEVARDPEFLSSGTLYLVVDPKKPRPLWVPEGDLVAVRMV